MQHQWFKCCNASIWYMHVSITPRRSWRYTATSGILMTKTWVKPTAKMSSLGRASRTAAWVWCCTNITLIRCTKKVQGLRQSRTISSFIHLKRQSLHHNSSIQDIWPRTSLTWTFRVRLIGSASACSMQTSRWRLTDYFSIHKIVRRSNTHAKKRNVQLR